MITSVSNDKCYEFRGLSTDTKPTENIGNGSCYLEMDTSKIYFFNETSKEWLEFGA